MDSQPKAADDLPAAILISALATLAIALPYWFASTDAVSDDGIFGRLWLVAAVLVVTTAAAGLLRAVRSLVVVALMLVPVPVAVLGRVVIDLAADPTSHNLWPIELVVSSVLAAPPVLLGALLARVIRPVVERRG